MKPHETTNPAKVAQLIMRRCDELGTITDEPGFVTRTFASSAMARANRLVGSWMQSAGMKTHVDAMGNLMGHYGVADKKTPMLLLGSHLDTVRHAGKYDGPLGVILAIACVQQIHEQKIKLPFAIRVAGFADEEGVRYHTTYLGSKAVAGSFDVDNFERTDEGGVKMRDAIKAFGCDPSKLKSCAINPKQLLGYFETHIEQGPVLEKQNLSVGIVTCIAGQSRFQLHFKGKAGHAGTTPMDCRTDALCAAAEFICSTEKLARQRRGLVATVGCLQALPGASNVIPGDAILTLDVRHQNDSTRLATANLLQRLAHSIATRRNLKVTVKLVQASKSAPCSPRLLKLLRLSVTRHQTKVINLPSGAGHDAAVLSQITPSAMLFIRCKGGVSHHPDESVRAVDVKVAFEVMDDFILSIAKSHA